MTADQLASALNDIVKGQIEEHVAELPEEELTDALNDLRKTEKWLTKLDESQQRLLAGALVLSIVRSTSLKEFHENKVQRLLDLLNRSRSSLFRFLIRSSLMQTSYSTLCKDKGKFYSKVVFTII